MIAVDTNVLIHADREEMLLHGRALDALTALAEGDAAWAVPIFCIGEFVRVVSHPRVFDPPTPAPEALEFVEALLQSPSVRLLLPGPRFLSLLRDCIEEGGVQGNLVFDAQIAAVCLEHGARTLLSEDRDFSRFSKMTVQPLTTFGS